MTFIDPIQAHENESFERAIRQSTDIQLIKASSEFLIRSHQLQYSYNFSWLGRPIIQYPQDMIAFQELVFSIRPDLIIETGIAHGGSLIFSASLLTLLDIMDGIDPYESKRQVIGIDVDIRPHNRDELDKHFLHFKLKMVQGSSVDPEIIDAIRAHSIGKNKILVALDSNHTHDHVFAELNAYAELVTVGSYCIVFDTCIEEFPRGFTKDRPWDVGNNPKTAVDEWLRSHPEFVVDMEIGHKLMISVARFGFLKRIY